MRSMLVISLLLTGCASWRIDAEFASYVESFEAIAAKRNIDTVAVSTDFDDTLPDSKLAICEYRNSAPNKIKVNPKYWYKFDPNCREAVIFHEMAHCALGLHDHDESVFLRKAEVDCAPYSKNRLKDIERLFKSYERLINN